MSVVFIIIFLLFLGAFSVSYNKRSKELKDFRDALDLARTGLMRISAQSNDMAASNIADVTLHDINDITKQREIY